MTREEARNILGEGASDTQVSNLLNSFQNITKTYKEQISNLENEKTEIQTQINDLQTKLEEDKNIKKELDDIKKANMTEQEQIEAQKKETQRLLDEAKVISNKAKIKNILAGENITEEVFDKFVDVDETLSIDRANLLKTILNATKDSTEKKVKEELTSISVEPNLSNKPQTLNSKSMDLESFLKMSSEKQEKFAKDYPEEYNSLMN